MDLDQLMSRYFRLRQELSMAYNAHPWQTRRIDRLADELACTEHEISLRQSQGDAAADVADSTLAHLAHRPPSTGPAPLQH